jgi:hypothetical protein
MTYHYQAKTDVQVVFKLDRRDVETSVMEPLNNQEAVFREYIVEVFDKDNNHICTGLINWQIKPWKHVKIKA